MGFHSSRSGDEIPHSQRIPDKVSRIELTTMTSSSSATVGPDQYDNRIVIGHATFAGPLVPVSWTRGSRRRTTAQERCAKIPAPETVVTHCCFERISKQLAASITFKSEQTQHIENIGEEIAVFLC